MWAILWTDVLSRHQTLIKLGRAPAAEHSDLVTEKKAVTAITVVEQVVGSVDELMDGISGTCAAAITSKSSECYRSCSKIEDPVFVGDGI